VDRKDIFAAEEEARRELEERVNSLVASMRTNANELLSKEVTLHNRVPGEALTFDDN
jgi:hypothetical protein